MAWWASGKEKCWEAQVPGAHSVHELTQELNPWSCGIGKRVLGFRVLGFKVRGEGRLHLQCLSLPDLQGGYNTSIGRGCCTGMFLALHPTFKHQESIRSTGQIKAELKHFTRRNAPHTQMKFSLNSTKKEGRKVTLSEGSM